MLNLGPTPRNIVKLTLNISFDQIFVVYLNMYINPDYLIKISVVFVCVFVCVCVCHVYVTKRDIFCHAYISELDEGINPNPFPHERYGQVDHIGSTWGSSSPSQEVRNVLQSQECS